MKKHDLVKDYGKALVLRPGLRPSSKPPGTKGQKGDIPDPANPGKRTDYAGGSTTPAIGKSSVVGPVKKMKLARNNSKRMLIHAGITGTCSFCVSFTALEDAKRISMQCRGTASGL